MLNKKFISVKFEESTSSSQINSFLTLMNLPVFVKPIYGWYNLIVDSADDVFTKYLALCESHYIKKCYISTFWKLHATPSDPLFENQWYLQKNKYSGRMGYNYW